MHDTCLLHTIRGTVLLISNKFVCILLTHAKDMYHRKENKRRLSAILIFIRIRIQKSTKVNIIKKHFRSNYRIILDLNGGEATTLSFSTRNKIGLVKGYYNINIFRYEDFVRYIHWRCNGAMYVNNNFNMVRMLVSQCTVVLARMTKEISRTIMPYDYV